MRVQNNGDADDPYVAIDYDEWVAAGREAEQEAKSGKRKLSISSSGYSTGNGEGDGSAQSQASAMKNALFGKDLCKSSLSWMDSSLSSSMEN